MDQVSRLRYVYHHKTSLAEETLEGKELMGRYARYRGINNKSYHVNNRIFKAKKWVEACHRSVQRLNFSGVNAHHQNRMSERRIR